MAQTATGEERGRVASPAEQTWGPQTAVREGINTVNLPITPMIPVTTGTPAPTSHTRAEEHRDERREERKEETRRVVEGIEFTRDQIELIKRTIAVGATDDELELFLYTCKRLRLDPFARQIYFMKRGREGNQTARAETSIDGQRLVAARTGLYAGQTPAEWADVYRNADGTIGIDWFEVWPFPERDPYAARVGVLHKRFDRPLYAIARWVAYVQVTDVWENGQRTGQTRPNAMWLKRGPEQLAKCAESLALRQAFPNELSGVYTVDEMDQADNPEGAVLRESIPARKGARRERKSARKDPEPRQPEPKDETPQIITRYDLLFPFPPHKDVPFDHAAAGSTADAPEYVVDSDTLDRAFRLAERALAGEEIAGKDGARRPITEAEIPKWRHLRDVAEAELIRRLEERDALAKAQTPDAVDVAAGNDEPEVEAEAAENAALDDAGDDKDEIPF